MKCARKLDDAASNWKWVIQMRDRNSKRTRVEPVFTVLERSSDPGWAQRLVNLSIGIEARIETGAVRAVQFRTEKKVYPDPARLAWMLQNWPRLAPTDGSRYREFIARMSNADEITSALRRLDAGNRLIPTSLILEGPSSADCLIDCERAIVWVEGKRDDWLAPGTSWDVTRDQLARNIEAAWIVARETGRDYCLIIAYEDQLKHHEQELIDGYRNGTWSAGWPHLDRKQRREFSQRIGTIRWREIAVEWSELSDLLYDA